MSIGLRLARVPGLLQRSILIGTTLLIAAVPAGAYSVQTHQQLVDLSWKPAIEPLLMARYPGLTAGQLREAHAYAYGGCAIQDLGYYPFGDQFFSDLLHYVRSGDFVQALLHDASSPDELAFALGALSHYVGDSLGHSLATNLAVPVAFRRLRAEYGPWVTYDEDPHAHVQAEFAFDVNEIHKDRFAPVDYLDSVGLEVPSELLSRAFQEVYGIPLHDILGGSQHPNLFGHQLSVHHILPRIAAAEAILHADDMPRDTPSVELDRMARELRRSGLDNGWDKFRHPAGVGTRLLATLVHFTPKIGPATMLAIKVPTEETDQEYVHSLNQSIDAMRSILSDLRTAPSKGAQDLPNRDLDTGKEVEPGAYRLTDTTYQKLLHELTHRPDAAAPAALQRNIATYYSDPAVFGSLISPKQWTLIQADLLLIQESASQHTSGTQGGISAMFFDSWMGLLRVVLVGILAYFALVLMLRISGKRTLSKMNVFDLIVTVALGSTLATVLLSKDVALAEGVLALALLILLQFLVAWSSVRSATFSKLVKASPRLLFSGGEYLPGAMRSERVTEAEVLAAMRASGMTNLDEVGAVILETDGSFTVLPGPVPVRRSTLDTVVGRASESATVGDSPAARSGSDS
ncbi:zinc dependent phospholipase C family protein [Terriglobus sp.]|uniref:zinc dependent phospholipase C family protein n=1 Tax=Terriglobus sp. TaxID=1889013 RepID=UPI003B00D360